MESTTRHTVQRVAATAAGLTVAILVFSAAGCSRDDATASRTRGPRPPAASISPVKVVDESAVQEAVEVAEPQAEERATADVAADPVRNNGTPIDPLSLVGGADEPREPGHDALLAALEDNGGNLEHSLREISERIEFSSRRDVILLNLKGPYITDASLEKIKTLDNLLVLDIWDAPITDAGLAHLAEMPQLRALGIRNTRVTNEGLKHLANLTSLKELNLTLTGVTDAGLIYLTGLKSLHALGLDDTVVTGTGINELQVALPLCRIAW